MLAEIYHKTSSSSEDELTGNFFGVLRYFSFNRGLQQILLSCIHSEDEKTREILEGITAEADRYEFWKKSKLGFGEIDFYIEVSKVSIGIEVKYLSGLSGEDQLEREAAMLKEWNPDGEKVLILWASETEAKDIYKWNASKSCFQDVHLAYITWEDAADYLKEIQTENAGERRMLEDLQALMNEKGFYSFKGFNSIDEVTYGGINMERGEKVHNAFMVVYKTLESIEKLMIRCRSELDESRYYMPMKNFMRYSSDQTWTGWIYWSFILLFQRKADGPVLDNGWIDGPVYAVEFNLDAETCDEPELLIAKIDFDDVSHWNRTCSPANHGLFYDAMHVTEKYDIYKETEEYQYIKAKSEYEEKVKEAFWGFEDLTLSCQELMDLNAQNYKDKIFGMIEQLSNPMLFHQAKIC